jgi:hypothetical protein
LRMKLPEADDLGLVVRTAEASRDCAPDRLAGVDYALAADRPKIGRAVSEAFTAPCR